MLFLVFFVNQIVSTAFVAKLSITLYLYFANSQLFGQLFLNYTSLTKQSVSQNLYNYIQCLPILL